MKIINTIIRAAIGWHFLYEGLIKLLKKGWSAESFLNNSLSFLSGFYHWLAVSPGRMAVVDFLNVSGLILIGLALFTGLFARWAALAGALLLTLYYFVYPPFGISMAISYETAYIVNMLFIETIMLVFLFFYKERGYGLDDAIHLLKNKKKKEPLTVDAATSDNMRRELLKNMVSLPVLGLLGWGAQKSHKLYGTDAISGATVKVNKVPLSQLKGELPKGKLGKHEVSRLILGGNLISNIAHARDLIYVKHLFASYNTEEKIYETLMLCELLRI